MYIKYTVDVVKELFKKNGCELLSEDRKNMYKEKLKFRCKCGVVSERNL